MPEAPYFRLVEVKALPEHKYSKRLQFSKEEVEILRVELQILLNKANNREMLTLIAPPDEPQFQSPAFPLGMFVKQNRDWVIAEIRRRLPFYTKARIRGALSEISRIMVAILHEGHETDILAFTSEKYRQQLEDQLKAKCAPPSVGRPVVPKSGKARKVVIVENGEVKPFKSIAEAARSTGYGYDYIQKNSLKDYRSKHHENSL